MTRSLVEGHDGNASTSEATPFGSVSCTFELFDTVAIQGVWDQHSCNH